MRKLIESNQEIKEIIEEMSFANQLNESTGWKSIKDQPNVKMIILKKQIVNGNTIIQHISKTRLQQLSSLSKTPPQINESYSLFLKPNSQIGAFVEKRLTLIYMPLKNDCIIHTWNKEKIITIPSMNEERLIAIGDNTPFSILSKSSNIPLVMFFNQPSPNEFLKIPFHLNSNNPKSKYFI